MERSCLLSSQVPNAIIRGPDGHLRAEKPSLVLYNVYVYVHNGYFIIADIRIYIYWHIHIHMHTSIYIYIYIYILIYIYIFSYSLIHWYTYFLVYIRHTCISKVYAQLVPWQTVWIHPSTVIWICLHSVRWYAHMLCSMLAILTNINPKNHPNVGKYTIQQPRKKTDKSR